MSSTDGTTRPPRRRLIRLFLGTIMLAGCTVQPTPSSDLTLQGSPSAQPSPSGQAYVFLPAGTAPEGLTMLANLGGYVRGDAATRCVWMELADGDLASVIWPRGYVATFDPLVIYDRRLQPIATEGDTLGFAGGVASLEGFDPIGLPPECRKGEQVWITGVVSPADD